jgi:hypothetical protein
LSLRALCGVDRRAHAYRPASGPPSSDGGSRTKYGRPRLARLSDGRLTYRLKTPWPDGTTHAVMERVDLLERLAALVPAPRVHGIHFYDVLVPAAKWRPHVVPWISRPSDAGVSQCPRCLRSMRIIVAIHALRPARKILESLGLPCPASGARPPNRQPTRRLANGSLCPPPTCVSNELILSVSIVHFAIPTPGF